MGGKEKNIKVDCKEKTDDFLNIHPASVQRWNNIIHVHIHVQWGEDELYFSPTKLFHKSKNTCSNTHVKAL